MQLTKPNCCALRLLLGDQQRDRRARACNSHAESNGDDKQDDVQIMRDEPPPTSSADEKVREWAVTDKDTYADEQ